MPVSSFIRVAAFDGPPNAVEAEFSRMARAGRLLRVRKGIYWKGRRTKLGMVPPSPEAVAIEVAGRGSGPAGVYAAYRLGLTSQVPGRPAIAVPGKAPADIPGVRFSVRSWRRRELGLKQDEVALIEVLRDWPSAVEGNWADLVAAVSLLQDSSSIRPEVVARDVESERHVGLRERWSNLTKDLELT